MNSKTQERLQVDISGLVQGVGFRPFVYRLANTCHLSGWVTNNSVGACVELEGEKGDLRHFLHALEREKPALAEIHSVSVRSIPLVRDNGFQILASKPGSAVGAVIPPDLAPCDECLRELSDPSNRRFRYPFTNCTRCGPRFSIVERLPYDRAHTAMKDFPLCTACAREYHDPHDRRFHAEPIACPDCGPRLMLLDHAGNPLTDGNDALDEAVSAIRAGKIVALKGVGGYQLLVDAGNTGAVKTLRDRKHRPHKPFALLYPDVKSLRADCVVSALEETELCTQHRPIVLVKAKPQSITHICQEVAPENPNLGVMLPASPLHHLLMQLLKRPLVATSGNVAGEPICIDNEEAVQRLNRIADCFLLHDREILRPLDDSIVRVMDGKAVLLRRARGFTPQQLSLPKTSINHPPILALGADLKNSVATCYGNVVNLSAHIGDLQAQRALQQFTCAIDDMALLHGQQPETLLCDLHPGYVSSRWARSQSAGEGEGKPRKLIEIQHHVAHLFSCMAEFHRRGSSLGVCWDGTGFGAESGLLGSEILHWNGRGSVRRIASLRQFPLPGGEQAIREPRRILVGLLYECLGERAFSMGIVRKLFSPSQLSIIRIMLERGINTPRCSSMGRLFDGVAVILGLVETTSFEGQAAMTVEYAAQPSSADGQFPFTLDDSTLDWAPMITALLSDETRGTSVADRAAIFHNTLAHMILAVAHRSVEHRVFLSGGVFQNKRLLEITTALLRSNGFQVHSHSKVPPNDGGIALGQIYFARCMADCSVASGKVFRPCVSVYPVESRKFSILLQWSAPHGCASAVFARTSISPTCRKPLSAIMSSCMWDLLLAG